MVRGWWLLGTPAVIVSLGSCASLEQQDWYSKAHDATSKAVSVAADGTAKAARVASDQASKAYARMQRYAAEKDLLVTFHDAGEHSESVVLDVLHKAGVGAKGAAPKRAPGAPAPGSAPASGVGATTNGAPTAPGPGKPLPDVYAGTMNWPIEAGIVSSEFGARWGKMHKGIDIAAEVGEPVYAIAAGEVIYAGGGLRGYGNVVILRHDRKRTSLYAHNSVLNVKQGDVVAQGTVVSLLGSTGHSTGPHVHFEIRDGDMPLDPRSVLPQSKLGDVLVPRETFASDGAAAVPGHFLGAFGQATNAYRNRASRTFAPGAIPCERGQPEKCSVTDSGAAASALISAGPRQGASAPPELLWPAIASANRYSE